MQTTGQQLDTASPGFTLKVLQQNQSRLLEDSKCKLQQHSPRVTASHTDTSALIRLFETHVKENSPKMLIVMAQIPHGKAESR